MTLILIALSALSALTALPARPALPALPAGFVPQQHVRPDTSSSPIHYRVYRADGSASSFAEIEEALHAADVVFVGESHDDPIVHYLQREILEAAHARRGDRTVALSMEMFSRDVQYIVDEYLTDLVTESQFLDASAPWDNYASDYRPLVEFAREHDLDVIAANAPRRYANRVSRLGRESLSELSETARSFLAPLPYEAASEAYEEQFARAMREAMDEMASEAAEEETEQDSCCTCDCAMMERMMQMHHGEGGMMHHGEGGMMQQGEGGMMQQGEGDMMGEAHAGMNHAADDQARDGQARDGQEDAHAGMNHDQMAASEQAAAAHAHMMAGDSAEEGDDDVEPEAETGEAVSPHGMAGASMNMTNMLDSQSLWDATMAWAIAEYRRSNPTSSVVHVVGSFHVKSGTGIPEHLERYAPDTKALIITVEPSEDIATFDTQAHANLGDFVILSDESLPRTFDSSP